MMRACTDVLAPYRMLAKTIVGPLPHRVSKMNLYYNCRAARQPLTEDPT